MWKDFVVINVSECVRALIGASLSEPHTYESTVCPPTLPVVVIYIYNIYIYIYMYVFRPTILRTFSTSGAPVRLFEGPKRFLKTSGTSRGRRGCPFRDERCEFSFTSTSLLFERETTLTVDHIRHWRDSFTSNYSTTVAKRSFSTKETRVTLGTPS